MEKDFEISEYDEILDNDVESLYGQGYTHLLPIEDASEQERDNADYVLREIDYNWVSVRFASTRLKNNKDFVNKAARIDNRTLKYTNKKLYSTKWVDKDGDYELDR